MSTEEIEDQAPELEEKNPEPEELPEGFEEFDTPADEVEVVEPTGKLQAKIELDRLVYLARSKNSMSVRVLQALLETQGYPVGNDRRGWLGDGTVHALEQFQKAQGWEPTGIWAPDLERTVDALFAASTRYERVL